MIPDLHSLLETELRYAYFNAGRTASLASGDSIEKATLNGVPYIVDSSRPANAYYNRAVIPPDFASLADVVQQLPLSVQAIELLIPQQNEEVFSCLLNAGFSPATSLCYLAATPSATLASECKVVELRTDQRDYFFDLLELSGASFSREKRDRTSRFYCTEEFRCFVAYDCEDAPASWATMYVDEGNAFLANAFTLPASRGRGIHSALLSARLHLASQLRLTRAFTDAEPASQSHRNCSRRGFRMLSVNNIWKRV